MKYTPEELYNYVIENKMDAQFITTMMHHVGNFTICELTDPKYEKREDGWYITAASFHLDTKIIDDNIVNAIEKNLYISPFVARYEDQFSIHFLVHPCQAEEKKDHEAAIFHDVIKYMIIQTIFTLKLDTHGRIKNYLAQGPTIQ